MGCHQTQGDALGYGLLPFQGVLDIAMLGVLGKSETDFEKWIYVLKHMETLERMPFETQKKIFKRVEDYMDIRHLKKEDMEKYEAIERAVESYNLGMYGSWVRGNRKGKEEGIKEGELNANLKTARKLLSRGMSLDQIMEITDLTEEQITRLEK